MGSTSEALVASLRRFRRKVSKRYAVKRMILFGPHAFGGSPSSDVELVVVSDGFRKERGVDRALSLYLEWDLNLPVRFLCYTPEEFQDLSRRGGLLRDAVRDGVPIPP